MLGGGLLNKHNSPNLQKFKGSNKKKKIICGLTVVWVIALASLYFYQTYAVFTEEKHFNVINGEIADPGDIYFAYYVDGEITRSLPSQNTGYKLDTEKSKCTNGVIPGWDYANWKFTADYTAYNATDYTRTRCNLYFVKETTVNTVLGTLTVNTFTPDFGKSACDSTTCETHEKGIFAAEDDAGTSYYYRGSVENNYVKFAGYYWRIIRINSNGSIRMIYDGTLAHDNGESSTDREYGTSQFNPNNNNNMYVGYMYTSGNAHGLGASSTIKTANDNFYTSKLASYSSYIDTSSGFCGDRSTLNNQSGVGTGTVSTYDKGYLRVSTNTPSLKCENSSDYYTVSSASSGNKALTYPIGLITADEVLLAGSSGGVFDGAYNYQKSTPNAYLTIGQYFWTMTPAGYYNPFGGIYWCSHVFIVDTSGLLDDYVTNDTLGLRPVINLKNALKFTGDGTKNNPYVPSL